MLNAYPTFLKYTLQSTLKGLPFMYVYIYIYLYMYNISYQNYPKFTISLLLYFKFHAMNMA